MNAASVIQCIAKNRSIGIFDAHSLDNDPYHLEFGTQTQTQLKLRLNSEAQILTVMQFLQSHGHAQR